MSTPPPAGKPVNPPVIPIAPDGDSNASSVDIDVVGGAGPGGGTAITAADSTKVAPAPKPVPVPAAKPKLPDDVATQLAWLFEFGPHSTRTLLGALNLAKDGKAVTEGKEAIPPVPPAKFAAWATSAFLKLTENDPVRNQQALLCFAVAIGLREGNKKGEERAQALRAEFELFKASVEAHQAKPWWKKLGGAKKAPKEKKGKVTTAPVVSTAGIPVDKSGAKKK